MAKMKTIHLDENMSVDPNFPSEQIDWTPLDSSEKDTGFIAIEASTFLQDAWRRFKKNRLALISAVFLLLFSLVIIIGHAVSPYTYDGIDLYSVNKAPSQEHWFGTDSLGRDLFIRVLYGGRISLTVGVVSAFINLVIGSLYGGISGYLGGRADQIMMRIVDILYSIPTLLYVLLITMVWGSSIGTVIIAIALSSWAGMARTVRAQVLSLKEQEFVLAERTLGASRSRVLIHHLLINAIGPIIVTTTLNVPSAIFTEAFLSFVGCGIAIPKASWGTLSNEALRTVMNYPYQMVFPVLAIALTMFSLNFIGDGFNDAFDPRREK